MAAPYYQNQNSFAVAVPTAYGIDVNLLPGEVVQGEPYSIFDYENILTLVVGPYQYPILRYSWPGSGSGSGGSGTITGVSCTAPIIGGGISGVVTVGLDLLGVTGAYIANGTITSDKLATGAAVTSLSVLTETVSGSVTLQAGTNVVLSADELTNTIVIGTDPNLVSSVEADLPLSVETLNGVATVSLNVTTTDNGGAVALQVPVAPADPEDLFGAITQLGTVAVSNVFAFGTLSVNVDYATIAAVTLDPSTAYFKATAAQPNLFVGLNSSSETVLYATGAGALYTTSAVVKEEASATKLTLTEDPWLGTNLVKFNLSSDSTEYSDNFINLPFSYYNTLTLEQTEAGDAPTPDRVGYGNILGIPSYTPLINFETTELIPAIKLGGNSETSKDLALAVHDDGSALPTIALYTDGTITCKRVDAQYQTSTNVLLPAGNYLVANYPGANTFVIDSSNGPSSIQLPELNAFYEDGVILTFKKFDITINPVVVSSAIGQTIDYDQTQYVLRTYKQSHAVDAGTDEPILHVLKVMSVVKPLAGKYLWISL